MPKAKITYSNQQSRWDRMFKQKCKIMTIEEAIRSTNEFFKKQHKKKRKKR